MRRIVVPLVFLAISAPPAAARTRSIVIRDIDFSIRTLRIHRGDTVRWLFRDAPAPHNVTSRGRPRFRSSASRQHGSFSVRFRRRGTYRYVCTIHPNMAGRVIVR